MKEANRGEEKANVAKGGACIDMDSRLIVSEEDEVDNTVKSEEAKPPVPPKVLRCCVELAVATFVTTLSRSGVCGLRREFLSLGMYQRSNLLHERFTANMDRNRFKWDVCLDASRVVLRVNVPPALDYIHANWIKLANVDKPYIATQGPLESTVGDFWRMCYQEKVTTVLVLCTPTKNVCAPFFPSDEKESKKTGGITNGVMKVFNKKVEKGDKFSTMSLEVVATLPDCHPMDVELVYYNSWADADAPASATSFLRVLRNVHQKDLSPCVVVCSAGIGRTSMAVTTNVVIERLFKGICIRLNEVVCELRGMRAHFVVNDFQYIYIASMILTYIKSKLPGVYDREIRKFRAEAKEAWPHAKTR